MGIPNGMSMGLRAGASPGEAGGVVGADDSVSFANQGHAAFEQGAHLFANPYVESLDERAARLWDDGWIAGAMAAGERDRRYRPMIDGRQHIRFLLDFLGIEINRELGAPKLGFQRKTHLWDIRERVLTALKLIGGPS